MHRSGPLTSETVGAVPAYESIGRAVVDRRIKMPVRTVYIDGSNDFLKRKDYTRVETVSVPRRPRRGSSTT